MATEQILFSNLLLTIRKEIEKAVRLLPVPFATILTDENGIILEIFCYSLFAIAAGLKVGDNLSKKASGVNGISLAMEKHKLSVVQGNEHSLVQFKDLNCIASPILCNGRTMGYLDLSVPKECSIDFAVPYIQLLAQNIRYNCEHQLRPKKNTLLNLDEYLLTTREREVALLWLDQKSALYIANQLGIKEGTVRTVIKRIYEKTKVSDRHQFIRKLTLN
ncbi:helix-turn-helix domain-containing protein [Saccharibacillus kuerlensis]|uniref:HTH luxR-type domain-containing protein n=1 Tax=Saccharibacillus kuerlensis TaxID=459527 RepID=A0ABQ2L1Z1_9BACL|nr:helix-turn-helix transcriptional regulator [Saccharibacillus kuerlensis]GGN99635.1 hypothetical protein GCM10010969_19890 [Saccharibacillus kuerlensis]